MAEKRSAQDIYWEEHLRVKEISDAELRIRRQQISDIAQKAESEFYLLLEVLGGAGRMTEQDAANERAAFRARIEADASQLRVVAERAKTIARGPEEPN